MLSMSRLGPRCLLQINSAKFFEDRICGEINNPLIKRDEAVPHLLFIEFLLGFGALRLVLGKAKCQVDL